MDLCSYEHRKVREMRRKDNKTSELDGDNVRYSVVGAWMMEWHAGMGGMNVVRVG